MTSYIALVIVSLHLQAELHEEVTAP